jgi:plasmid stabilization system protein ParE
MADAYRVTVSPGARQDILRLHDFLIEKSPAAAERALAAFEQAFRFLAHAPLSFRVAKLDPLLREMVIAFGKTGYVVLFHVKAADVYVLAVRHSARTNFTS